MRVTRTTVQLDKYLCVPGNARSAGRCTGCCCSLCLPDWSPSKYSHRPSESERWSGLTRAVGWVAVALTSPPSPLLTGVSGVLVDRHRAGPARSVKGHLRLSVSHVADTGNGGGRPVLDRAARCAINTSFPDSAGPPRGAASPDRA